MAKTNFNLVLDLDATLINTFDDYDSLIELEIFKNPKYLDIRDRTYMFQLEDDEDGPMPFWGVYRPYAREFLEFSFSYFNTVGVWSAGKRDYVDAVVEHLFEDLPKPHYTLSYDECDFDKDGDIIKPLDMIFKLNPMFRPHNTIIIDDNQDTMINNRDNGILIPRYEPEPTCESIRKPDYALPSITKWLSRSEVISCNDIRTPDKLSIFSLLIL